MISISMTTADTNGSVIIPLGSSELSLLKPRTNRESTLDGEVVVTHSGMSHGDRNFMISTTINAEQKRLIDYIATNAVKVGVSCKEGYFIGVIETSNTSTRNLVMTILVESKEA